MNLIDDSIYMMRNIYIIQIFFLFFAVLILQHANAQTKPADTTNKYKIVVAGPQYKSSSFHQWLWGSNYRKEWTTPVTVPVILLDSAKGGLTAYKAGGGHQTKSLHIKTKDEKEYALRSVDKTLAKVIPQDFQHTFIENIVNDEVSMSHPYAAASVPLMAEKANIYHTYPQYVFLPEQAALDTFNKKYGNKLYLFEQRLDGDWHEADNLGNFKKFINTEELLKKIYEDNDVKVDQRAFARARLFDMFIGDWDRHEDQWGWGEAEAGNKKRYEPVPQDRDQAYSKHNGVLLNFVMSAGGLNYMQPFDNNLRDVRTFNYEERNLDRFFTNQMTLSDWQNIAKQLQQSLTDDVIETALKQLPPEIFPISGNDIILKLKARRSHLEEYAATYYLFLAKEVEIVGSKQREHFEIKRLNDNETSINLYKIENDKINDTAFYSRIFKATETEEVRLYGLSGEDSYTIDGNADSEIKIRIIGGNDKDSVTNNSSGEKRKVHVYDDANNFFKTGSQTKLHLSNDTSVHTFRYAGFLYDKKGIKPSVFYSNEDRIYVGLGYQWLHHKWRKEPFASKQLFDVHYSLSEKAFSVTYLALFPQLIGKWDFALKANYDAVRWTHFFGLGNETQFTINDINFYTTRTEEWIFNPGVIRRFGKNTINFSGFFQNVKVIQDTARFINKTFGQTNQKIFKSTNFAGAQLGYNFHTLNDSIVPTKGFIFSANAIGVRNLTEGAKSFVKYTGNMQLYVPLISKFSFVIRTGAATIQGRPEFYQYASIGGPTLRGYRRDRFWGKTVFYNTNDLRFISTVRTHIFNGKAGVLAFFDDGRVWMPGENSNTWHTGYGGGIILSPFNKILADVTYGISNEEKLIQIRISKYF